MKIAFVGVQRKFQELPADYRDSFVKYHLELPYYYSKFGGHEVIVTTVDHEGSLDDANVRMVLEKDFSKENCDVVVHWRKWFPNLYQKNAINLLNSQDHSFGQDWKFNVKSAIHKKALRGILCFPSWHWRHFKTDVGLQDENLFPGVTLGVDTDIYSPSPKKDPYQLLWASDPGRGLERMIKIFVDLFRRDQRFRLHVCHPDYVSLSAYPKLAGIISHGNVPNGPKLWNLFNECGTLAYPSTFMEPSSRAHRQAQAAGSLVLYPPGRGTPSELIENGVTGLVSETIYWPNQIHELVESGRWKHIGDNARAMAVSENWQIQAARFTSLIQTLLGEKNA